MKILIIGSKGFIGNHALNFFKGKYPGQVYGADVVVDYTSDNYFLIDTSNSDFSSAFEKVGFDICINCSGAASVAKSFENPTRDYYLNTANVFKILEAIRKYNDQCKLINLSSAAVYGNPVSLPIHEEMKPYPISPYGWHKFQSELLCKEYYDQFNIQSCCLRIFSVYGSGLRKQLFWDLYQKAMKQNPVPLWGTGKESRDFIYIKDLLRVFEVIIEKCDFKANAINVASGVESTIEEVASVFLKKINPELKYHFSGDVKEGDPQNWKADLTLLNKMGFQPEYNLEKGLTELVKWIKENG